MRPLFERVAAEIADVHDDLVDRREPLRGVKLLDVACETGDIAEPVAVRGTDVVGADFATSLIDSPRACERASELA